MTRNRTLHVIAVAVLTLIGVVFFTAHGTQAQNDCPPLAPLSVGGTGYVNPVGVPNTLRAAPGLDSQRLGSLEGSRLFEVIGAPQCVDGYNWWQVRTFDGITGWTADGTVDQNWLLPNNIAACLNSPSTRLFAGGLARVTPGEPNSVRELPGQGDRLGLLYGGQSFAINGGPVCGPEGRTWWQVKFEGEIGWTAEGEGTTYWLEPIQGGIPSQPCTLAPRLQIGATGIVLPGEPNALRDLPGLDRSGSTVIGRLPAETVFTVLDGPSCVDGFQWWLVDADGDIGWTPLGGDNEYWVAPLGGLPGQDVCSLSPRLAVGTMGIVLEGPPNALRDLPGLDRSGSFVTGEITAGTTFTVDVGPECVDGYQWWLVNTGDQIGWTAEGEGSTYWLAPLDAPVTVCSPRPRLSVGTTGIVTPGEANVLRDIPGLNRSGSSVIGRLTEGATFTVLGGPRCVDGYNWWQVTAGGETGWTAEGEGAVYWLDPLVCYGGLYSRIAPGMTARVTDGLPNRLRSAPDADGAEIITRIPAGDTMIVLANFACDDMGRLWWQVEYNGTLGWTVENNGAEYWLEPAR